MIEFLKSNYSLLISIVVVVFDLVVLPIFKSRLDKATKDSDLLSVVEKLPAYISEAESLFDQGRSKLAYVLQKVHLDCVANHQEYDETLIMSYIEDILETPQKK